MPVSRKGNELKPQKVQQRIETLQQRRATAVSRGDIDKAKRIDEEIAGIVKKNNVDQGSNKGAD